MSKSKKILVVEDDQMMRDLYVELLLDEGHQVETAEDGIEGEKKMKKGGYDLVLLDIMLPEKDGLDILETLTNEERSKCGKIVFLTNLGQEALVRDGFDLGADGYLFKSAFNPDEIMQEVRGYLEEE